MKLAGTVTYRIAAALAVVSGAAGSIVACGLSLDGLGPIPGASPVDASLLDSAARVDASSMADGTSSPPPVDAAADDSSAPAPADAAAPDTAPTCVPFDAGPGGAFALPAFTFAGSASYNENADGRITLTNSQNNQAGAAWYPTKLPPLAGYDLTWTLRVGPSDTAGDGITFAMLASGSVPGVGDTGEGLGLRNVTGGDGGIPAGYAVDVDMFQNSDDPTDLGATTLKLVTMPGFKVVAETLVPAALNDGNLYAVDVSWRAPSSLSATLRAPDGGLVTVSSTDPGLTASSAYLGFTAATGGGSDSHNEVAGIAMTDTCQ